jgi:hypothetical protein
MDASQVLNPGSMMIISYSRSSLAILTVSFSVVLDSEWVLAKLWDGPQLQISPEINKMATNVFMA